MSYETGFGRIKYIRSSYRCILQLEDLVSFKTIKGVVALVMRYTVGIRDVRIKFLVFLFEIVPGIIRFFVCQINDKFFIQFLDGKIRRIGAVQRFLEWVTRSVR